MEVQLGNHPQGKQDFNLQSPFSQKILNEFVPSRFKMLVVESFDGSTNLLDNLEGYRTIMRLQSAFDALLCVAFPITLKKSAKI